MRFAEKVRAEANEQRRLRAIGAPIPPEKRRYTRLQGLFTALLCTTGGLIIVALGITYGALYYAAALFLFALAALGAVQAIWGRNFMGRAE